MIVMIMAVDCSRARHLALVSLRRIHVRVDHHRIQRKVMMGRAAMDHRRAGDTLQWQRDDENCKQQSAEHRVLST